MYVSVNENVVENRSVLIVDANMVSMKLVNERNEW